MTELTDEKGAQRGFLMVVLNIHIDDMDWLVALLFSGIQIWGQIKDSDDTTQSKVVTKSRNQFFVIQKFGKCAIS